MSNTTPEFAEKQDALALFLFNLGNGGQADSWDIVLNHPAYGPDYYNNYMADAEGILRDNPHLVGLGTREKMRLDALEESIQAAKAELQDGYAQDSAEVYYNGNRALILVPGEKHVRKQLLVAVTDLAGEHDSAYVKSWASGIRDTRIQ